MNRPSALETLWDEEVVAAVEWLAANRVQFTVEDVRERVTEEAPHRNAWGSVFKRRDTARLVQCTGRVARTHRPEANRRWVFIWEPKEPDAVLPAAA